MWESDFKHKSICMGNNLCSECQRQPPEVFSKRGQSQNFCKDCRKHLRRSIFLNIAGLRTFPAIFAKFWRTPFWKNSYGRLLLECLRSVSFCLLLLPDNARFYYSHIYLSMYLTKNYGNAANTNKTTKRITKS